MAETKNRRSFIVELLSTAAGTWVAIGGLLGAATAASGCGDDTATKYGGPKVDGPVMKYGGASDKGIDGMVLKYGGPPDGAVKDLGPVVKYGGWDASGEMSTKYGGVKVDGLTVKYGGPG
jgi:hypothetical protein